MTMHVRAYSLIGEDLPPCAGEGAPFNKVLKHLTLDGGGGIDPHRLCAC